MDNKNENEETFQFVNEEKKDTNIKEEKIINEEETESFVTGLPDWDLTPPYEVIRRVTRK